MKNVTKPKCRYSASLVENYFWLIAALCKKAVDSQKDYLALMGIMGGVPPYSVAVTAQFCSSIGKLLIGFQGSDV